MWHVFQDLDRDHQVERGIVERQRRVALEHDDIGVAEVIDIRSHDAGQRAKERLRQTARSAADIENAKWPGSFAHKYLLNDIVQKAVAKVDVVLLAGEVWPRLGHRG